LLFHCAQPWILQLQHASKKVIAYGSLNLHDRIAGRGPVHMRKVFPELHGLKAPRPSSTTAMLSGQFLLYRIYVYKQLEESL